MNLMGYIVAVLLLFVVVRGRCVHLLTIYYFFLPLWLNVAPEENQAKNYGNRDSTMTRTNAKVRRNQNHLGNYVMLAKHSQADVWLNTLKKLYILVVRDKR